MTNSEKTLIIIGELQKRLDENYLKRIQVLLTKKNNTLMIKVVNMDLPGLKERVKDLIERTYPESLMLIEEKKTVLIYAV